MEIELKKQKDILSHQAHHDALTGLPNRTLFQDKLKQSIEFSKRKKTKTALLFIDLDGFKAIDLAAEREDKKKAVVALSLHDLQSVATTDIVELITYADHKQVMLIFVPRK